MGFYIQTEGFDHLDAMLTELGQIERSDLAVRKLYPAMRRALQPAYDYAHQNAAYGADNKSGIHMRDTLRVDARVPSESDRKSGYYSEGDFVIGVLSVKKSAVSLANEFGTAKMAQRPFLVPALQANIDKTLQILSDELAEILPSILAKAKGSKGDK